MITRAKLIEQIRRRLAGGNIPKDFPITKEEVEIYILQRAAYLLRVQLIENIRLEDNRSVNPHFVATFSSKVNSSDRGLYADIASSFVDLMGNRGIQRVWAKGTKWGSDLVPLTVGSSPLLAKIPAGNLEGRCGYFVEGNRIYLFYPKGQTAPSDVNISMVTAESGDLDPAIADAIRNSAIEFFGVQFKRDVLNDENSDIKEEIEK